MRPSPYLFFCLFLLFERIFSTDIFLNFASGVNLGSQIKEIFSKRIEGTQFFLILYANKTICKYDSGFKLVSMIRLELNEKNLSNLRAFYSGGEIYYGGIVDKNEFFIISESNLKVTFSLSFSGIVHVSIFYLADDGFMSYAIYYNDMLEFRNKTSLIARHNFSLNSPSNAVLKVMELKYANAYFYHLIFTASRDVHLLSYNCFTVQKCNLVLVRMVFNLNSVNSNQIVWYFQQMNGIIIVQFSDGQVYAFSPFNANKNFNLTQLNAVIGPSIIKKVILTECYERIFVLQDRSLRFLLNSTLNLDLIDYCYSYNFLNQIQNLLNFPKWTGLSQFTNDQGLIYIVNSSSVFGYCFNTKQNTIIKNCNPIISCPTNCISCDTNYKCLSCFFGFRLYSNLCYPMMSCQVSNCQICSQNQTCVKCSQNFTLNLIFNSCDSQQIILPLLPILPILPEHSQNITQNSTLQNLSASNLILKVSNVDLIIQSQNSFSPSAQQVSKVSASLNKVPGARQIFGFLYPIFALFDDYWYYVYHEGKYTQLEYIPLFLVFIYTINQEKIVPDIFNLNVSVNVPNIVCSDYTNYTNKQIFEIDQHHTQFSQNIGPFLFQQLAITFFGTIFVRIIIILLSFCIQKPKRQEKAKTTENQHERHRNSFKSKNLKNRHQENPINLTRIKLFLEKFISFRTIVLKIIGSNLIFLSFVLSTQLRILFAFNILDIANLVCTLIFGFTLLAYTFFIAIDADLSYKIDKKQVSAKSKTRLDFENKLKKSIRYFQTIRRENQNLTYFSHIKNILLGFVNGFFLSNSNIQYPLLILIKTFLIFILLKKKKIFESSLLRLCGLLYYISGILIDLLCYLSKSYGIPQIFMTHYVSDYSLGNIFEIVCLIILSLSIVSQILGQILVGLKQFSFKKNKIAATSEVQNSLSNYTSKKILEQKTKSKLGKVKRETINKDESESNFSLLKRRKIMPEIQDDSINFEGEKSSDGLVNRYNIFRHLDKQKTIKSQIRSKNTHCSHLKNNSITMNNLPFKRNPNQQKMFTAEYKRDDKKTLCRGTVRFENTVKVQIFQNQQKKQNSTEKQSDYGEDEFCGRAVKIEPSEKIKRKPSLYATSKKIRNKTDVKIPAMIVNDRSQIRIKSQNRANQ